MPLQELRDGLAVGEPEGNVIESLRLHVRTLSTRRGLPKRPGARQAITGAWAFAAG